MKEHLVRLSKTMSHALRHKPAQYGLTLDADGWVAVEDLLTALRQHRSAWAFLQEKDLEEVIAQSEKQRFEMRDGNIRAFYGHLRLRRWNTRSRARQLFYITAQHRRRLVPFAEKD